MFKIAMIGCGAMAESGHAPAVHAYARRYANTALVACCDTRADRATLFTEKFGFARAYTDWREMIARETPDAVLLLVPPAATAPLSMEIMRAGTNILLEKPPGLHADDARAIHACAIENHVHARVAFNRRYMPLLSALREEIACVGETVQFVDCQFLRVGRTDADFCTTAIHAIDSVRTIVGQDYASAQFTYQDFAYTAERRGTNYYMRAQFTGGAEANISFLTCSGCVAERILVVARNHAFQLELPVWNGIDMPGRLVCMTRGSAYKTVVGEYDTLFESNGFYGESESFFEEIRSGAAPASDVITGVQPVEIADAMRARAEGYTGN